MLHTALKSVILEKCEAKKMNQKKYYELPTNGKLYNFPNETFNKIDEPLNEPTANEDDWFCKIAESIVSGKITLDDAADICNKRKIITNGSHH